MEVLTVVNRTSKTLAGTWDGRHYDIPPGKSSHPAIQARKFREQNPLMGSEDPQTLFSQYLIGIEEDGDDCSPVEQTASPERWNRAKTANPNVQVVKGNGALYATERHSPLGNDSMFDKP